MKKTGRCFIRKRWNILARCDSLFSVSVVGRRVNALTKAIWIGEGLLFCSDFMISGVVPGLMPGFKWDSVLFLPAARAVHEKSRPIPSRMVVVVSGEEA